MGNQDKIQLKSFKKYYFRKSLKAFQPFLYFNTLYNKEKTFL
jgi:hypothetical protein